MGIQTNRRQLIGSCIALAVALTLMVPLPVHAAAKAAKAMSNGEMKEHCQDMMKQKTQLTADLKAEDADLTAQITRMNNAPEDKKLDLMAAILTKFVEQRSAMNIRRETMQTAMATHMADHGAMGHDSLAQCPMMKGEHGSD